MMRGNMYVEKALHMILKGVALNHFQITVTPWYETGV